MNVYVYSTNINLIENCTGETNLVQNDQNPDTTNMQDRAELSRKITYLRGGCIRGNSDSLIVITSNGRKGFGFTH